MTLTHEIHSSELRSYRRCRQQWQWQCRDSWTPVRKSAALEDGTVWHKALEVLYDPDTWTKELTVIHTAAHQALLAEAETQRTDYLRRAGKNVLDEEEALDYNERIFVLRSMLVKLCRSLNREKYRPIAVEQEFSCPILDENGRQLVCSCNQCLLSLAAATTDEKVAANYTASEGLTFRGGLPVTFNCRVDALFEDREGLVYVVDHKSTSMLYRSDSIIPELEDQLPLYLWCLKQNSYPVHGVILNQFRKAYPKPPQRLERMYQGRLYSVSKMQMTDYDTAVQVFRKHDARAYQHGLYNDYLRWLTDNGPEFSRQFVIFKTPEQLEVIGRNLTRQTLEIIDKGPAVYPNPSQMNCTSCSYQLPCFAVQSDRDPQDELEASFVKVEPYYIQRRRTI